MPQQIAEAQITPVVDKAQIDPCGSSALAGDIVDAAEGASGNAGNHGELQAGIEECVQYAGGKQAAQAAFSYIFSFILILQVKEKWRKMI